MIEAVSNARTFRVTVEQTYDIQKDGESIFAVHTGFSGRQLQFTLNSDYYCSETYGPESYTFGLRRNGTWLRSPVARLRYWSGNLLGPTYECEAAGEHLIVNARNFLIRSGNVYRDKKRVGRIRIGINRFRIDLPDDFDIVDQLFIWWLVFGLPGADSA